MPKGCVDSFEQLLLGRGACGLDRRENAAAGLGDSYEAAHARLAVTYHATTHQRLRLLAEGRLKPLPGDSQCAADKSYFQTTARLCEGLEKVLNSYAKSADPHQQRVYAVWSASP